MLDHEEQSEYFVTIIASDAGSPRQTGSVLITVSVTDRNDNAPQFTSSNYSVNVNEGASITAPILTVTVHDEDEINKFHYKVREGTNGENSGDCSLRQNCDSVLFIERLVCNRMIDRGNFIHVGVSSDTEHLVFNLCKHFIN